MAVRAVYNRDPDRLPIWFVKGAPEIVLEQCFLYQTRDGRHSITPKIRKNYLGKRFNKFKLSNSVILRPCELHDAIGITCTCSW